MLDEMININNENLIAFLETVLEFYADPKIYQDDVISKDLGYMAKKGLERIEKTNEYNNNLIDFSTSSEDVVQLKIDFENQNESEIIKKINNLKLNLENDEDIS